jgi:predicted nucleic acid-binding protein
MIVVDASLGVKWFLDEAGSDDALAVLIEHRSNIIAPDLFAVEVAAALVREINAQRDEDARYGWELARLMALFESDAVALRRAEPKLVGHAAEIAIEIGHPLKDCVYLALAVKEGCDLVTCDARFAAKAAQLGQSIKLIRG